MRARLISHSITVSEAATKAPEAPAALPSVPMYLITDQTRQAEMREAATPLCTEHAEAVCVVDHQPGVETLGQCEQNQVAARRPPSMLKTASVRISLCRAVLVASKRSSAARSLCA